jgi:hypothetical protein
MILLTVWFFVVLFHKHRFILMRRFFSISGTIFMLRCITMLITSLSVPGTHLECQPRPYGDVWNKLYNAYVIWTGAGMTLQVPMIIFDSPDNGTILYRESSQYLCIVANKKPFFINS